MGEEVRRRRPQEPTGPNQHPPHPHVADEKDAGQGPENPPEGSIFGTGERRERLSGKAGTPMEWRVSTKVRGGRGERDIKERASVACPLARRCAET